jgi:large subunit ribosomal protein L34e|mmetsp:Transcript_21579/g.31589  ORF Transcript_21579/g.31589 Transcript_21579/m.31589 type:complete len:116 (+) Transcript_21579:27-374(+)
MKNNRFVKRSSFSYSTKSNKIRVIRTPGNRLNTLNMIKKKSSRTCPIEKTKINGLTIPGSRRYSNLSKKNKTISRPYGGCLSIHALKKNIIKAFLIEEKKLAKKVLRLNKKKNTN